MVANLPPFCHSGQALHPGLLCIEMRKASISHLSGDVINGGAAGRRLKSPEDLDFPFSPLSANTMNIFPSPSAF